MSWFRKNTTPSSKPGVPLALDVCTHGLRAKMANQQWHIPTYLFQQSQEWHVGESAQHLARVQPNAVHASFWEQLSSNKEAHMAFAHLETFWESMSDVNAVAVAVPSWYTKEALGIFSGMCKTLNIPLACLVDRATLATTELIEPKTEEVGFLSFSRQGTWLSLLTQQGHEWEHQSVTRISSVGWLEIERCIESAINDQFVSQTPYEPFHHGHAAQRLFDKWPAWLRALKNMPELSVSLQEDDREYKVLLKASDLAHALQKKGLFSQLDDLFSTLPEPWIVDDKFALLPGLRDYLMDRFDVHWCEENDPVTALHKRLPELNLSVEREVRYLTSLPVSNNQKTNAITTTSPTIHVSLTGEAELNGQRVAGKIQINPGDELKIAGETLRFSG